MVESKIPNAYSDTSPRQFQLFGGCAVTEQSMTTDYTSVRAHGWSIKRSHQPEFIGHEIDVSDRRLESGGGHFSKISKCKRFGLLADSLKMG